MARRGLCASVSAGEPSVPGCGREGGEAAAEAHGAKAGGWTAAAAATRGFAAAAAAPPPPPPEAAGLARAAAKPNPAPRHAPTHPDKALPIFLREPQPVPTIEPKPWTAKSKRTGAVAVKVGMTQRWDAHGAVVPLTVLWLDECQVIKQCTPERDGYRALQMGAGYKKRRNVHFMQLGHFDSAGVPPKRRLDEFRVSEDGMLPVGFELGAGHFVPGQYVDIRGVSKGKGTQGVMKRHGFAGGNASHGSSKHHRKAGSTGGCQDPGRRWKGTKMAGRMGNEKVTTKNAFVFAVDERRNLVFVKGCVPGKRGSFVRVRDAKAWKCKDLPRALNAPFPAAPRAPSEFADEQYGDGLVDPELGTENTDEFRFRDPLRESAHYRVADPPKNPYGVYE